MNKPHAHIHTAPKSTNDDNNKVVCSKNSSLFPGVVVASTNNKVHIINFYNKFRHRNRYIMECANTATRTATLQTPMKPPPHHDRFTALFLGPPGTACARRELLDFMVQGIELPMKLRWENKDDKQIHTRSHRLLSHWYYLITISNSATLTELVLLSSTSFWLKNEYFSPGTLNSDL